MKRLILLLICALYVTTAAQAQISFYGEWCRKGGGEKTIMIFDMKEKKAYVMNEARKTCMVMEEIDKLSTNKLVGYDWEVSHSTSREFLGMEEIDGKECAHYYVKSESIYKDGGKDGAGYHEWIYSPMKVSNYNGCIAHDNTVYVMDRTIVLRCVKMGPQPAHLFQVSHSTSREFLGMEEIDGKECAHYYVKSESIYKDGGKDGAGYHEWIYSPMKVSNYNGCIAHDNTVYVMDRTIVLRCVKMGPQPAHLFQVPEGYQMTVMPAGGLLEMMTGKSCEENTQKVDETRDAIQKSNEQIKEQLKEVNDKSKSDEERMKALLEMLGGQKKK